VSDRSKPPTPYPDLNEVLDELVRSQRSVLGASFVGTYLQGSFAVGDFDEHSDVDFIVALEDELSEAQVEALQAMHGRVFELECEWARHLEGSYFPRAVLRDCSRRGELLWYLDNGSRVMIRSDHCNTAVVRTTVREYGVSLSGPEPATLVDPVPVELLRREILSVLTDWGGKFLAEPEPYRNRFYQGFIVLSYCRMLHDLEAGSVSSKRKSAEWAKSMLDQSWTGLIDRAWLTRPDPAVSIRQPPDAEDFARTLEFVSYVMAEAERNQGV
jgi:predicted nucleotidyltransferase